MGTSKLTKQIAGLATAGIMAAGLCAPAMAFADGGLQDGTQTYTSGANGAAGAWNPSANTNDAGGAGQIQLVYSTEGGQWQEPGPSTTETEDNIQHDNGTYVITIPKLIKYENMAVGTVQTSADYTINVRGALEAGKTVTVSATASGSLTNAAKAASDDSAISFSTTQGKTTWSAADAFGTTANPDGSLSGTNATDTIALSGTAKSAGTWKGVVQYSSSAA